MQRAEEQFERVCPSVNGFLDRQVIIVAPGLAFGVFLCDRESDIVSGQKVGTTHG